MRNVLLLDCETTDIDPKKGHLIEVGAVLWSVEYRSIVDVYSGLLSAPENPAESVNGIPSGMVASVHPGTVEMVESMADRSDCIVAHNAPFDESWIREHGSEKLCAKQWICTIEDMEWPQPLASKSLINIALANGVAVVSAHRAIHDCLLLARLFESIPDIAVRLDAAMDRSRLPKGEVISLAPFGEKDIVKSHGFHWDPMRKVWHRTMVIADAEKLPFRTRVE